jgi:uncharacterized membrane protein YfcA
MLHPHNQTFSHMATHTPLHGSFHLSKATFFDKPIARWFSLIALVGSIGLSLWVGQAYSSAELMLKVGLFTVPSAVYMVFRTLLRQA